LSEKALRRAGLDYLARAALKEHSGFEAFIGARNADSRLIAMTTKAARDYTAFTFRPTDILMFGRESAGLPQPVHETADSRLRIPMREGMRSLHLAVSVSMVLGEALRQTDGFP
jgi:tRNA (cytidine/uridine-2'-O-)-methyltransferase